MVQPTLDRALTDEKKFMDFVDHGRNATVEAAGSQDVTRDQQSAPDSAVGPDIHRSERRKRS